MPIRNLTERSAVTMRFPTLGRLRKGGKAKNQAGKEYPVDLAYFRFTSDNPEIVAAFKRAFGEEPKVLRVFLPFKTLEENFSTWQEEWLAGGLVHRCDGETMTIWQNGHGKYEHGSEPCPYFAGTKQRDKKRPGCLPVGRLAVIIPELLEAGFVGYVTLTTGSINDLRAISASLMNAEEMQRFNGRDGGLRGIEFRLWRQEESISTPTDDGKRARRRKWMVQMAPAVKWVDVQYQLERAAALGVPLLAAGVTAVDQDEADADDEQEAGGAEEVTGDVEEPVTDGEYTELGDEWAEADEDGEDDKPGPPPEPAWPGSFSSRIEAIAWAAEIPGAFAAQEHVANAYDVIRKERKP
jgi:hypothetical protein